MLAIILMGFTNVHAQLVKLWEVSDVYKAPESVAYDSKRGCLYISNYTQRMKTGVRYGAHFISKANLQGQVLDLEWLGNLTSPLGICIFEDKLYIVERFGVVVYDLEADKVINKIYIKTANFLNDITVDNKGRIYVSESDTNVIYRIQNNQVETWMDSEAISRPNGVLYDNGKLIVGVNSDNCLKAVTIDTKEVTNIAHLGPGIIDGVKKCGKDYLVTLFMGNLLLVTPSGQVTELLNTREKNINLADFEYIEDKQLVVIPALWNNKLMGYQLKAR
jgi:hypothetical protein